MDRPGAAQRAFLREAQRHGAVPRAALAVAIQAVALLVTPPERLGTAVAALLAVALWLATGAALLRTGHPRVVLPVDVGVVVVLCLLQAQLDVPELILSDSGWVFLAAETALVAYPWQFGARPAALAVAPITAAYAVGAILAGVLTTAELGVFSLWLVITCGISMLLQVKVFGYARDADREAEARERAIRAVEVAEARRDSESAHLAALHDTVASTLLMVGAGAAPPAARLRAQVERDLAVLREIREAPPDRPGDVDLRDEVRGAVATAAVRVDLVLPPAAVTVPAPVARAVAGALGEALHNVARHAGLDEAAVRLTAAGDAVHVEIRDHGTGFAAGGMPGRGIRHSIIARMERVGGSASVTSGDDGVRVDLGWTP